MVSLVVLVATQLGAPTEGRGPVAQTVDGAIETLQQEAASQLSALVEQSLETGATPQRSAASEVNTVVAQSPVDTRAVAPSDTNTVAAQSPVDTPTGETSGLAATPDVAHSPADDSAVAKDSAPSPVTRAATLVDERPTTGQLIARAALAPVSAAIGTGTGIGIGASIGFGLGSLVDALAPPGTGSVERLLMVGIVIGAAVGYLLGSTSPGQLFETSRKARGWAALWGALVTAITGAACAVAVATGVFFVALPWLIAGGATLAIAVPVFADLTRPRSEGLAVAVF